MIVAEIKFREITMQVLPALKIENCEVTTKAGEKRCYADRLQRRPSILRHLVAPRPPMLFVTVVVEHVVRQRSVQALAAFVSLA
jgi:hypothetical protein